MKLFTKILLLNTGLAVSSKLHLSSLDLAICQGFQLTLLYPEGGHNDPPLAKSAPILKVCIFSDPSWLTIHIFPYIRW